MTRRNFASVLGGAAFVAAQGGSAASPYGVQFVDVAKEAGLRETVVYGGVDTVKYIVEANGCGVACFDFDNDGWLDLLVLNGSRIEGFPKGQEPTNHLYKNNRDGTFTDVTKRAGLARSGWAQAVTIGDYDNDGFDDVFITYWGRNVLYHNNGDGTFTDVTERAGLSGDPKRWSAGCCFVDYDRDGKLDLFVSAYVGVDLAELPLPGKSTNCTWKGIPVFCGPRGLKGTTNLLYRNNGDGTFSDVSKRSRIILPGLFYGMSASPVDFDDDGWPDIFLACDSTPSILYRNDKNGTFTDTAVPSGVAYAEDGREQSGMGLAFGDYDGDGHLDIVKTLFADDMPALYHGEGGGFFVERSMAAGLNAVTNHVQWGTGLVDFDNDGWPDLFFVTGHVYPEVARVNPDYPYRGPRVLYRNMGNGKFELISPSCGPGLNSFHSSRGCAFGDFDNDGDLDVLVMNMNEPPSLIRCDVSNRNSWLKVKLIGTQSNRTAIGARVRVKCGTHYQVQEVQSQSSYYSVNDFRLHFGLGAADSADSVEVRWPNGRQEVFRDVPGNRLAQIREGAGKIETKPLRA